MTADTNQDDWPDDFARMLLAYGVDGPTALARVMGLKKSTAQNWASRGVSAAGLKQARQDTKRSLEWLVFGQEARNESGPVASSDSDSKSETSDFSHATTKNLKNEPFEPDMIFVDVEVAEPLVHYAKDRVQVVSGGTRLEFVLIPKMSGRVSAGSGYQYPQDEVVGEIAFESGWMRRSFGRVAGGFALIDVHGTSMEPTFYDGETILVDRQKRDIDGGGLFVIRLQDELFVKRVQRSITGGLQVMSDNPSFQAELIPKGREQQLTIIGRVVWPRSR